MAKNKIVICLGSSCFARGNSQNVDIAEKFFRERGLSEEADVDLSGGLCTGHCSDGPIVVVNGKICRHVDAGAMLDLLNGLYPKT